jgi:membrane-bound lytic murein transglycosylase B
VLASTANLLKVNGWRAGARFGAGTEYPETDIAEYRYCVRQVPFSD